MEINSKLWAAYTPHPYGAEAAFTHYNSKEKTLCWNLSEELSPAPLKVSVRASERPFYWLLVFPLPPKIRRLWKGQQLESAVSTGQMFNRVLLEITGWHSIKQDKKQK